jgi:hypothetical protein
MRYSRLALAALSLAVATPALAAWDPADRPYDRQLERRANLAADSGSAVATRGAVIVQSPTYDPSARPDDAQIERRANSVTSTGSSLDYTPSYRPESSYRQYGE